VRAPPICKNPVGEGAKRVTTFMGNPERQNGAGGAKGL
jgi:hypothetical protein